MPLQMTNTSDKDFADKVFRDGRLHQGVSHFHY